MIECSGPEACRQLATQLKDMVVLLNTATVAAVVAGVVGHEALRRWKEGLDDG